MNKVVNFIPSLSNVPFTIMETFVTL